MRAHEQQGGERDVCAIYVGEKVTFEEARQKDSTRGKMMPISPMTELEAKKGLSQGGSKDDEKMVEAEEDTGVLLSTSSAKSASWPAPFTTETLSTCLFSRSTMHGLQILPERGVFSATRFSKKSSCVGWL